jgi:hypothetical protein
VTKPLSETSTPYSPGGSIANVKRPPSSLVAIHVVDVESERTVTDAPGVAASCASTTRPANVATAGCANATRGTTETTVRKTRTHEKRANVMNDESLDTCDGDPRRADRTVEAPTA